jgi:uncharacterized repeat protein (TIGR04138 family)
MLCAKCREQPATVHHSKIYGDKVEKINLCAECAGPLMHEEDAIPLENLLAVLKTASDGTAAWMRGMEELVEPKARYPIEAYEFVIEALDFCEGEVPVSGGALLESIRHLAIRKFGREAKAVLRDWKIFATEDFWNIIAMAAFDFDKVEQRFKGSLEEFQNAFDFNEAFPES